MHHTGVALAREGYVVLCPDALYFEERQSKYLDSGNFERFEFLRYVVSGKCMAWKNILDMRRAVDYLCSRPEVRSDRIGCCGDWKWSMMDSEPQREDRIVSRYIKLSDTLVGT